MGLADEKLGALDGMNFLGLYQRGLGLLGEEVFWVLEWGFEIDVFYKFHYNIDFNFFY